MGRYLVTQINKDLKEKMVIITGPRQVGKTTLAKTLISDFDYFNYDRAEDRFMLQEASWDRKKKLVIFDELHKMPEWKRWLKGIYDTEENQPHLLITGSAKVDTYRKVGDSLAGRYFAFRLHPFDLKEMKNKMPPNKAFENLWYCSGFPEPFLKGQRQYYRRWKRTHTDIILRQDLLDLKNIHDIKGVENLTLLLKNNVGSTISYSNLASKLEKNHKTIKEWLQLLENLYVIFRISPYSKKIDRSLLKEPKYYFYDFAQIENDGVKLENLVACALLKELHFLEDVYGKDCQLHFLKTKDGKEIDFLIVIDKIPTLLIEVKSSNDALSKNFQHFAKFFPRIQKIQLVKKLKREKTYPDGTEIRALIPWLTKLNLNSSD